MFSDSVATQLVKIERYVQRGDYAGMYRYMAGQVAANPQLDYRISLWLLSAAEINEPGPANQNVLKLWVWRMNDAASRAYGKGPVTDARNQDISNGLAQDVRTLYVDYLNGAGEFTAQQIFDRDVQTAVLELGVPESAWAGGLLGIAYGFDVLKYDDGVGIFSSATEIDAWISRAIDGDALNHRRLCRRRAPDVFSGEHFVL